MQQHVGRLDVAVDDARLVQRGGAARRLGGQRERVPHRQRAARPQIGEGPAGGVLHHEVRPAVREFPDVVDLHHPAGSGPAQQPGLGQEALPDVEPVGPVLGEDLHRHRGLELGVVREPHRGEGAAAQRPFEAVAADPLQGVHTTIMPGLRSTWRGARPCRTRRRRKTSPGAPPPATAGPWTGC